MEWQTTSTILVGLRDPDDRDVWSRFVARFRTPIVSFARKMGLPAADAEDAAQETLLAFVEAYRTGNYDASKGHLGHWLFGIAFRQVLRARRTRARREGQLPREDGGTSFWAALPDEESATDSWNVEWEQAILQQCLEQVRREVEPVTYAAFEKVVRGERPPTLAAQELGISLKAVYNAKHRILKRIRQLRRAYEEVE